ncbi:MAG: CDP-diacylglycerol--glycerol-3-phosphate 3-phosphatidyltransferase [Roseburia sp.]
MNLPNKLTIFRVILILPFVLLLLGGCGNWGWFNAAFGGILPYVDYIAVAIFIIASLTDLLDGKIARKYNLVTNFGKFMDPLADKLLVSSALICLVEMGRLPAWIVIIIISREFIISGFRLIASDNGIVIAASYWGKFKTTFQMLMVIVLILNIQNTFFQVLGIVLTYVALILTVISLIDYIAKNKDVLKEQK